MRSLITLACFLCLAAPAAAASCPEGARCGSITVPLDHSGATRGTLPLAYAVLPATGPRAGTMMFLTGGPGQSAVPYANPLKPLFDRLRRNHDVVLVDQRGTGGSGEVDCNSADVERCAKRLGSKRAFLTTAETARDVEDLRAALGVERVVVLGVSYGTKVAGEYARRFPERTAAVVLDSPVGVDGIDFVGLNSIEAMPRVLRETCATGPCAGTVADPGAALYGAVERARGRKVRDVLGDPLSEEGLLATLQLSDADPVLRADLPATLASLARGDTAPFEHLFTRIFDQLTRSDIEEAMDEAEEADEDISWMSMSRFIATACLETKLPWSPASDPATRKAAIRAYLAALGKRPFAPFRPSLVFDSSPARLCRDWPATAVPEPVPAPGPDVPVLVLSGRADLRTPLEDAQRVAAAYPHATLLAVPGIGHSVITADESGCAVTALLDFLATRSLPVCSPPPALEAGAYLSRSAASVPAAAEQTVAAVRHDVQANAVVVGRVRRYPLSGLRGGYTQVSRERLTLHKVVVFRGRRVSGRVSADGDGVVTVNGRRVTLRAFKAVGS